jgi:ACT domain
MRFSSIFFITTYFSDYILVPLKSRGEVVRALQERGFFFEEHSDAYVTPSHHRNVSSTSSSFDVPPGTPPPASVDELQKRTFTTLKKQNITPRVDPQIRLIQCAGRSPQDLPSSPGAMEHGLHLGLVKCLVEKPQFLSVTLTDTEPASLLLQKESVVHFDNEVLLGSKEEILIPITFDLRELPLESTGIVCGVAGKLVGGSFGPLSPNLPPVEMSYLSTARAGTVMVGEAGLDRAIEALKM